ncbi:hypothetical protein OIU78_012661 [Salix suchowensis]|nr:hypothetical protein OIU78_012661 [Salix suchowensis]
MVASSIGLIIAAVHYRLWKLRDRKIILRLRPIEAGHAEKLERFPHYVVFSIVVMSPSFVHESSAANGEPDADSLFVKLVEEFERCILSYFAFHWSHADLLIGQVLNSDPGPKRKLKQIFMAATRERTFERVTKDLKVARVFSTLVEEMRAMGLASNDDSQCTEVMAPVAHCDRSPVLLFMGGGMGAGKSTVLKDILNEPFWARAAGNAVVIEADAFKESDVIYKALSSRGHVDMIHTAELVHQSSTDAASSLLVTALNEGRDVIMDGTLSWVPFVVQTITMARNVHRRRYRMGAGYKVGTGGAVTEEYWEKIDEEEQSLQEGSRKRKPYRIELVGVVCDAYLAVVRGIRRAIMCRRAVRVKSQLKSHKRFANAFLEYCHLVDNARLYCTNALEGPPKRPESEVGIRDLTRKFLVEVNLLDAQRYPNPACEEGSIWKDIVLSPSRLNIQKELKYSIQKVERSYDMFRVEGR